MKIAGILLLLLGLLILIGGIIACVVTLTSNYATTACARAANDRTTFAEAKQLCGGTTSDCYKTKTIGLTTDQECEDRKSFMTKQLVISIVPVVIGGFFGILGIGLFAFGLIRGRKKANLVPA